MHPCQHSSYHQLEAITSFWEQNRVEITKPISSASSSQNAQNTVYLTNIVSMYGRCRRFAAVTLRSPVNSPHKGQWHGALMFSLICARINGWVNNREADDLRRHQAHCDVIVMGFYLTHWRRDKMTAIFQTAFSIAFSWVTIVVFWWKFHWTLFPWIQLTIFQHWFRWWLGAGQATSHYLNQWCL